MSLLSDARQLVDTIYKWAPADIKEEVKPKWAVALLVAKAYFNRKEESPAEKEKSVQYASEHDKMIMTMFLRGARTDYISAVMQEYRDDIVDVLYKYNVPCKKPFVFDLSDLKLAMQGTNIPNKKELTPHVQHVLDHMKTAPICLKNTPVPAPMYNEELRVLTHDRSWNSTIWVLIDESGLTEEQVREALNIREGW